MRAAPCGPTPGLASGGATSSTRRSMTVPLCLAQERLDAELRPGFELLGPAPEFAKGEELGVGQARLAGCDRGVFEVVDVDDAQVDPADGGGVVVDQSEAAEAAGAGD